MASVQVIDLKRKALACKKAGDIEGAKRFLRQAKQLEQQQQVEQKLPSETENENANQPTTNVTASPTKPTDTPQQLKYEDPVNKAIDEANLEELTTGVTFTVEEMLDVDTMIDLQSAEMEIPTETTYQENVMKLKRAALQAKKNGDIPQAKERLATAKKLEKAADILFRKKGVAPQEEDDGEDYSLLEELMQDTNSNKQQQDDGFFEQLFGKSATVLELEDLDDMDATLLRDMMEAGMQVPTVQEVQQRAHDKKALALQFKKSGDLVAAKSALAECKQLEQRSTQLSDMLKTIESGACEELDPEAALEAMLEASEAKPVPQTKEPETLKSSQEYRLQAVQLKQEGKKEEAIAALRLYKKALANENAAKLVKRRQECVEALQKEAEIAKEQQRRFRYYQRFVDRNSMEHEQWKTYEQECTSHAFQMEAGGEPFELERGKSASLLELGDLSFVGKTVDPTEERIEVALMELFELQTNNNISDCVSKKTTQLPAAESIRVTVTINLPPSLETPDESISLNFIPDRLEETTQRYDFGKSQFIHAERGPSRFAKLVARRLTRRRCVNVEVFLVKVKRGIFSSTSEEILLGGASLELKDLLETNAIVADLPLLDSSRRRQLGGCLRLAIRSGSPFGDCRAEEDDDSSEQISASTGLVTNVHKAEFSPFCFPS